MPVGRSATSLIVVLVLVGCGDEKVVSAEGRVAVAPTALDFGPVWVGERIERTLTLTNTGRVPVTVRTVGLDVPFDGQESTTVPPAGKVTVPVGFRPSTGREAERDIVFEAKGQPRLPVKLRGEGVAGDLTVAPELAFGPVRAGRSRELSLAVRNEAPLGITDFRSEVTGEDSGAFSIVRPIRQMEANSTAELAIVFAPRVIRSHRATLVLVACSTCPEKRVALRGEGIDQDVVATPSTLDFGAVSPGRSHELRVTFQNLGKAVAELREARVAGSAFSATRPLAVDLGENQTYELPVSFAPTIPGDREGTLSLLDSSGEVAVQVALRGRGGAPTLDATPSSVDLGLLPLGGTGRAVVSLANVGEDVPVELVGATIEGGTGWSVAAPPLPAPIGTEGVAIEVSFAAVALGDYSATLALSTSIPYERVVRIPLAVRVLADRNCDIVVRPSALRFGLVRPGETYHRDVEVANEGTESCAVSAIDLAPEGSPLFALTEPPGQRDLAPGGRLVIPVTFTPTYPSLDIAQSVLRFRTSDFSRPEGAVEISGYAPGLDVFAEPEPVNFGKVALERTRELPVRIVNRGYSPVRIDRWRVAGEGDSPFQALPQPITWSNIVDEAGAELRLQYVPDEAGPSADLLEVWLDEEPEPLQIRLLGEGDDGPCGVDCDPPVAVCPAPGSGEVGHPATLVGSGVDPNGDPVTCMWTTEQAPPGSSAEPLPWDACTAAFTPFKVGNYTIRLDVRDSLGNTGSCVTTYSAHRGSGLWVEYSAARPFLFHPAGGLPSSPVAWFGVHACTENESPFWSNPFPDWDQPGIVADDPAVLVRWSSPAIIKLDAPTLRQDYYVGVQAGETYNGPNPPQPLAATVGAFCGGQQVAHESVILTVPGEKVWVGTVRFESTGTCSWTPVAIHLPP